MEILDLERIGWRLISTIKCKNHVILRCLLMEPEGGVGLVRLLGFHGYGMNMVSLRKSVSYGGRGLMNASAMIAERETLRMGIEHLTVLFPTEVSAFDVQVENSARTVQYKLNAQSLRLFGVHSDVNDVHRAGANRLQNKQKNPFGSLVEYYPNSSKDHSRIHQFGKNVLPGLFLGYALYAGRLWKGDILVADIEELETMDASEIYSKRLNAKEVIFHKEGEFIFPAADGRIKLSGGDQEPRTPTLIREHPIRGESQRDFLGESEGSLLPPPQDSLLDAGEAINDFWSMSGNFIYRHHVEPRVKLYSPREESFPIPLKYIDVSRTSHTNVDLKQEKRID